MLQNMKIALKSFEKHHCLLSIIMSSAYVMMILYRVGKEVSKYFHIKG